MYNLLSLQEIIYSYSYHYASDILISMHISLQKYT